MKLMLIREVSEIRGDISQGMGLIGTIAKEKATVRILDNNSPYVTHSRKRIVEKIRAFGPDIIGFHVHTHNIHKTGLLVAAVKEAFPHTCLIGGGIHAYYEPGEIVDLGIHIVATEEADLTILPLLDGLQGAVGGEEPFAIGPELTERLLHIPGLLFDDDQKQRHNSGRPNFISDLDQLPFVDHSLFNLEDYIHKSSDNHYVTNTLLTQRGCPFSCSFCQGDDRHGAFRMARTNSPRYRFDYVKSLYERYGHDYMIFFDANFTLHRKKTLEFCDLMIHSELKGKIKFYCETNVLSKIDTTMATALRQAGFVDMALGIERLTPDSLIKINKRIKADIIDESVRNVSAAGIRISANALIGFPFDTEETIREEEKRFSQIMEMTDSTLVTVVLPLPGTRIHKQTRHKKWYLEKDYINWRPPFYHTAYNYHGIAWHTNFFDLDEKTMTAIRGMCERMWAKRIHRINSRVVSFLFFFVELLAKGSLALFRVSPTLERIFYAPVTLVYATMWKLMVSRFYVNR